MENWIEKISEPQRLYLAWQAPDHMGDRFRWAVAVLESRGSECTLRYVRGPEFRALNRGRTLEEAATLGFQGHPAFKMSRNVHTDGVLATLMRRLPPRTRPDFFEYRRQFRLSEELKLSDFALLGLTEAKLPSDGFSIVDPLDPEAASCDLMLEIAGHRYYAPLGVSVGHPVELRPEPDNPKDAGAVRFAISNRTIGHVNRLQAPTFLRWLAERHVTGAIERINGDAERPRVFVFVRVRPAERRAAA